MYRKKTLLFTTYYFGEYCCNEDISAHIFLFFLEFFVGRNSVKANFSLDLRKYYNSENYECFMAAFCFAQTREHCFHDKSVPLGFLSAHCLRYHITNEGTVFHWPKVFLFQALLLCHYRLADPANGPFYWMKQLSYLCGLALVSLWWRGTLVYGWPRLWTASSLSTILACHCNQWSTSSHV